MSKVREARSKGSKTIKMAPPTATRDKGWVWLILISMYPRPLVAGEPAGPSMVSEVPGPVSQQLHSELSSIQAMDSVHFFADYDKYVIVNVY